MTINPAVRTGAGPALLACALAGLLTATGCSSSSPPSWASALGSNVTISGPAQASAGNGSPGAVITGLFASVTSKHYSEECAYVEPKDQATCKSATASLTASVVPTFQNTGIGYVATDGNEALVGTTGKFCVPNEKPECYTNNDPAAIFSSNKKSFSNLWTQENKASSSNVYSLAPCIEIGGKWYLYEAGS